MKVLALIGNKSAVGAVEIYRVTLPFTYLNKESDIQCGWMRAQDARQVVAQGDAGAVFDNDIIVLHRTISGQADAGEGLIQALQCHGAKVVYEADDDYSGRHREANTIAGQSWKPYLPYVDAVTVTTKPLARLAAEESGGKPVHIVPNAIDRDWFSGVAQAAPRMYPDHLTIMFAGTVTHGQDWEVPAQALPRVLENHPNVKAFVVTDPPLPACFQGMNVEFIPPVQYTQYPALLAQADILCAPLVPDDPFNACKSPIKAIEGWCAARPVGKRLGGCAVVATNCGVYRGTVQNRHNGLLVKHTPEAWYDGLSMLVQDKFARRKLQVNGLVDARRYDMATRWQNWHRAYNTILGGSK